MPSPRFPARIADRSGESRLPRAALALRTGAPRRAVSASLPTADSHLTLKKILSLAISRYSLGEFLSYLVSTLPRHLLARSAARLLAQEELSSFAPPLAPISNLPVSPEAQCSAHPIPPSRPPSSSPLPPIATLLRARRPSRNDRLSAAGLQPAAPPSALIALDLTISTPTSARTAAGGVVDGRITPRRGCCADSSTPCGVCAGTDAGVCEAARASAKG